ncbi:MAG: diguanylate cyclase domain-containing protein [Usitatibacter sp.]
MSRAQTLVLALLVLHLLLGGLCLVIARGEHKSLALRWWGWGLLVYSAGVSGGVALYPDDGTDWDRLFAAADRRLYAAKESGRNRTVGRDIEALQGAT